MYVPDDATQKWLETFVVEHEGVAGSVHVERGGDLYLTAARSLPPPVIAAVTHVPRGKGMAGVAQTTRQPTQTCNLQTDDTGLVKPGARAVSAQAAIAIPVLDESGGIVAIVGIAYGQEGEIPPARVRALIDAAAQVPRST
jgi:L-methionine (R)-S-oxide reductase